MRRPLAHLIRRFFLTRHNYAPLFTIEKLGRLLCNRPLIENHELEEAITFYRPMLSSATQPLCFDIGANVGLVSSAFHALGARVVSVEPNAYCYYVLSQRFQHFQNGEPSVTLVNACVGSELKDHISLHVTTNSVFSRIDPDYEVAHSRTSHAVMTQDTSMTTLDQLIQMYGLPDLCKIDVEGYEPEVFKGLSQALPQLSFEFHSWASEKIIQCIDYIEALGQYRYNITLDDSHKFVFSDWVDRESLFEKLPPSVNKPENGKFGNIFATLITSKSNMEHVL